VIDSAEAADQPFRIGARTWRGVLAQAGVIAVGDCLVVLIFALAFGWSEWLVAVGLTFFLATWLLVLGASAEWTIEDQELRRRRWLSRPGSEPFVVMALGPQVEMIHEGRHRWRLVPNGPVLGAQPAQPWQTRRLVEAMEQAGVRIDDWRGDWARRHRVLDALGLLTFWGGLAGIIVMPDVRAAWPGLFTATAGLACSGAVFLGLAIDWLPWSMRNPARDG
jgi:hypothetical protein